MEGLYEGHINPFAEFCGEYMALDCLQEEEEQQLMSAAENTIYESSSVMNSHPHFYKLQMPFLQMLQKRAALLVELEAQPEQPQPNSFQMLLRLQEEQLLHRQTLPPAKASSFEKDSCVTDAALAVEMEKDEEQKMERKKRKRCRSSSSTKKAEEAESQRMSHIAVERNRRRLMNEHLAALRSLMPPSYITRGDQASIVGGAIDFVKVLEQHLQSLQAEKQSRTVQPRSNDGHPNSQCPFDGFFTSPQYTIQKPTYSSTSSSSTSVIVDDEPDGGCGGVTSVANIEVMLIQTHVNLRIFALKRPGQLVRAIAAIEELHLTVLHLNVTSVNDSVLYSLNLKTEEECKLGSANEIATAVHRIFSYIDSITEYQQR